MTSVKGMIEDGVLHGDVRTPGGAAAVWAKVGEHGAEKAAVKEMGDCTVQSCYCTKSEW